MKSKGITVWSNNRKAFSSIKEVRRACDNSTLYSKVRKVPKHPGIALYKYRFQLRTKKIWLYVQSGADFLRWICSKFENLGLVYSHNETIKFTWFIELDLFVNLTSPRAYLLELQKLFGDVAEFRDCLRRFHQILPLDCSCLVSEQQTYSLLHVHSRPIGQQDDCYIIKTQWSSSIFYRIDVVVNKMLA